MESLRAFHGGVQRHVAREYAPALAAHVHQQRARVVDASGDAVRLPLGELHADRAAAHRVERAVGRLELPRAPAAWVSHVLGPAVETKLSTVLRERAGAQARYARTRAELAGLRAAYAEPQRLGVDRWLAMLALWTERRQAFCVVNAGTALTFDAVDAAGRHLGGLIAPGLATAQSAIRNAARFGVRPPEDGYAGGLGQDTEGCVREGALHACAGLVERGARLAAGRRVISGGDAQRLLPHLGAGWESRPDVVLEGLLALARAEAA